MRTNIVVVAAVVFSLLLTGAAVVAAPLEPAAEPPQVAFNRLHDFDEVTAILKGYAAAYPGWVTLESIGTSIEGRDMWLLTLSNPATGPAAAKPAMYVDGNIHGNEVQGGEATLYTLAFLLRNYGRLERITELMDRVTFYLVPVVNPDGRAGWFRGPSTPHFPRTVMQPVDDDRDGLLDEDGYDDLDGDGVITQMRKQVPEGQGSFRLDRDDPRILERIEPLQQGDWVTLGGEGFDNDGDGRVNEDGPGYVDANRTWGFGWQPTYVQGGAGRYPLAIPETRSIALWALDHPNIAGVQSFHNYGRMILRGPGAKADGAYPPADARVYDLLGEEGEKILPGYQYMVTWEDLYTVYADTTDHFYRVHGAVAFTNELYDPPVDADGDGEVTEQERMAFNDRLTGGRQFRAFEPFEHPQYGAIEIGGWTFDTNRVPESFLLEEEMHRNAMFVLFHASELPAIGFGAPRVERLDRGLYAVTVPVVNERATPTMLAIARRDRLHRPDLATVAGAEVLASGLVEDEWLGDVTLQEHRPERLEVPGVPGRGVRRLYFLLRGGGPATITYDSLKGGRIETVVELGRS